MTVIVNLLSKARFRRAGSLATADICLVPGLPLGLDFNPHTRPIPTEKPVGIPAESPYP